MKLKLIPVLSLAVAIAGPVHASVAHLTLNGTPGDFITGGKTIDNIYSSADPLLVWNFVQHSPHVLAPSPNNYLSFTFLKSPADDDEFTLLEFSTRALGTMLAPGTYTDAERAPFASVSHPGLSISYGHRGCNTLSGSFTIKQLDFKAGTLDTFDVSFSQACDGGALMSGSFYYNARLTELPAVSVPEPASLALFGFGVAGLGMVRRKRVR